MVEVDVAPRQFSESNKPNLQPTMGSDNESKSLLGAKSGGLLQVTVSD